jgi:hypothetical protein
VDRLQKSSSIIRKTFLKRVAGVTDLGYSVSKERRSLVRRLKMADWKPPSLMLQIQNPFALIRSLPAVEGDSRAASVLTKDFFDSLKQLPPSTRI